MVHLVLSVVGKWVAGGFFSILLPLAFSSTCIFAPLCRVSLYSLDFSLATDCLLLVARLCWKAGCGPWFSWNSLSLRQVLCLWAWRIGHFQRYSPPPLTSPVVTKLCLVSLVGLGQERGTCFSPSGSLPLFQLVQVLGPKRFSWSLYPTPTTEQTVFASILPPEVIDIFRVPEGEKSEKVPALPQMQTDLFLLLPWEQEGLLSLSQWLKTFWL